MFFSVPGLGPDEVSRRLAEEPDGIRLIDIRPADERAYSNIGGTHVPVFELADRIAELEVDRDRDLVLYCRSGHRSASVVAWLRARGFSRVFNLEGGINAWSRVIDPKVRAY